eukprot:150591-Pyramimonas_sp.AAC.1
MHARMHDRSKENACGRTEKNKRTNRRTKRQQCSGRERRYCTCASDWDALLHKPALTSIINAAQKENKKNANRS